MLGLIHFDRALTGEVGAWRTDSALHIREQVSWEGEWGRPARGRAYMGTAVELRPDLRTVLNSSIVSASVTVMYKQRPVHPQISTGPPGGRYMAAESPLPRTVWWSNAQGTKNKERLPRAPSTFGLSTRLSSQISCLIDTTYP